MTPHVIVRCLPTVPASEEGDLLVQGAPELVAAAHLADRFMIDIDHAE